MTNKYGLKAQKKIQEYLHKHKHSGKFKNRQQAIAVGLDQARRQGAKVPDKK